MRWWKFVFCIEESVSLWLQCIYMLIDWPWKCCISVFCFPDSARTGVRCVGGLVGPGSPPVWNARRKISFRHCRRHRQPWSKHRRLSFPGDKTFLEPNPINYYILRWFWRRLSGFRGRFQWRLPRFWKASSTRTPQIGWAATGTLVLERSWTTRSSR